MRGDSRGRTRTDETGLSARDSASLVRDWYMRAYPEDELGDEISHDLTFGDALSAVRLGPGFYDATGVADSVVRERVFQELACRLGADYDEVYDLWIEAPERQPTWETCSGVEAVAWRDAVNSARESLEEAVREGLSAPSPNWSTLARETLAVSLLIEWPSYPEIEAEARECLGDVARSRGDIPTDALGLLVAESVLLQAERIVDYEPRLTSEIEVEAIEAIHHVAHSPANNRLLAGTDSLAHRSMELAFERASASRPSTPARDNDPWQR